MKYKQWIKLTELPGELQAEIIKGLLEANDIPVQLIQEGAGRAYGIMSGPLGGVQIYVPNSFGHKAKLILSRYSSGELDKSMPDDI